MNYRTIALLGVTVLLASCSGGGGSNGVPSVAKTNATTTTQATAHGRFTFTIHRGKKLSSLHRKPAYIGTGTTNANLLIDDGPVQIGTCVSASCSIGWTSTPGLHTFTAEIDDGSNVIGEGSATYTLNAGDNGTLDPLTINGVPATVDFTYATSSFSVSDADGYAIVSPGTFDGYVEETVPLTFTSDNSDQGYVSSQVISTRRIPTGRTTASIPTASGITREHTTSSSRVRRIRPNSTAPIWATSWPPTRRARTTRTIRSTTPVFQSKVTRAICARDPPQEACRSTDAPAQAERRHHRPRRHGRCSELVRRWRRWIDRQFVDPHRSDQFRPANRRDRRTKHGGVGSAIGGALATPTPTPTATPTAQATTAAASGSLSFTLPASTKLAVAKASLFVDGGTPVRVTCGGAPIVCAMAWTSTPGSHVFTVEVDDGTNVVAEGRARTRLSAERTRSRR